MRMIRVLKICKLSRAVWFGGLSLCMAAYMLHCTGQLLSQAWAQERGKLTSRSSSPRALPSSDDLPGFGQASGEQQTVQLLREGAKIIQQSVTCRASGDRLLVELPQTAAPLVALENLAAERILKAIQGDIGSDQWSVSGSITEFQGRNYILLDRVTRGAKR